MRHQAVPAEMLTERLCIRRFSEAEHHEVKLVPPHRESAGRHREGPGDAAHDVVVSVALHFIRSDGDMVELGEFAFASHSRLLSLHSKARDPSMRRRAFYSQRGPRRNGFWLAAPHHEQSDSQ